MRSDAGIAVDTFYVTGRRGGKLDPAGERELMEAFEGRAPRRRFLARRPKERVAEER